MKTHTRCRSCGARRCLSRHPDHYKIVPKCLACGSRKLTVDAYRMAGKDKRPVCHLDCAHYPHRTGSNVCNFKPDGSLKEFNDVE